MRPLTLKDVRARARSHADPEDAVFLQRFFKSGPGEYAEGDRLLGIRAPVIRRLAREFALLDLNRCSSLLKSEYHEERLLALIILVIQFRKAGVDGKKKIYDLYLSHTEFINNWDLVDLSAEHIVGGYLVDRSRRPLYRLARSRDLWERRISILSTLHFIRRNDFEDTFGIAKKLLHDEHDLIHKAVGWMLREAGNRSHAAEVGFLKIHYRNMPRTMLRYAIERFPERERRSYLKGTAT